MATHGFCCYSHWPQWKKGFRLLLPPPHPEGNYDKNQSILVTINRPSNSSSSLRPVPVLYCTAPIPANSLLLLSSSELFLASIRSAAICLCYSAVTTATDLLPPPSIPCRLHHFTSRSCNQVHLELHKKNITAPYGKLTGNYGSFPINLYTHTSSHRTFWADHP